MEVPEVCIREVPLCRLNPDSAMIKVPRHVSSYIYNYACMTAHHV